MNIAPKHFGNPKRIKQVKNRIEELDILIESHQLRERIEICEKLRAYWKRYLDCINVQKVPAKNKRGFIIIKLD